MKRILLGLAAAAVVLAVIAAFLLRVPAIQDAIVSRGIARLLAPPTDDLTKDDALRVVLCGSSSPLPHPSRARPCVAVFAGGHFYVVDTGTGSWNNLALWRVPGEKIGGVFLTHFHSDHIGELGEFNLQTWVAGREAPLAVYGPPGVERVVAGFSEAYALDSGYRIAHHGADFLKPDVGRMEAKSITLDAGRPKAVALETNGLTVTAFAVDHKPVVPAYAYRFDYKGRSVVVSGDTVKDPRLIEAAKGADVLFHEAQAQHIVAQIRQQAEKLGRRRIAKITGDIPSYHTSPVEAAEVANAAGVKLLVFYHLTPPPTNRLIEQVFLRGVDAVRPNGWVLGHDGLVVELPIGSDQVRTRDVG
jgi:ribonuclease Z